MLPCYGGLNLPGRMGRAGGAPDSDEDGMILKYCSGLGCSVSCLKFVTANVSAYIYFMPIANAITLHSCSLLAENG